MATDAERAARAPEQATQPRTKVRWSIVRHCFLGGLHLVGRIEPLPVRTT